MKCQQRHVNTWGIRAVVGVAMVVGMFFARRWGPLQLRRMDKKLSKILLLEGYHHAIAPIERTHEEQVIRAYLAGVPARPLVIVGPEGCGKSTLIRKVLTSRVMTLFLDLRAGTIITGDELVAAFIQQSGYILQSTDPLSSLILKADKAKKISGQEFNSALDMMQEVLRRQKLRGWKNGVPVICIDHVHTLNSSVDLDPQKPKVSDDSNFLRLIDWCITVTDRKLAHVLLITSPAFAHLDLDRNTSFRDRRAEFYIGYPQPEDARAFILANMSNAQTHLDPKIMGKNADVIVECVGGHVRDFHHIIDDLTKHDGSMKALRLLVTESIQHMVDYMEGVSFNTLPISGT